MVAAQHRRENVDVMKNNYCVGYSNTLSIGLGDLALSRSAQSHAITQGPCSKVRSLLLGAVTKKQR